MCVKNMNCGTRGNCEHRYDSGLEFNWSGSEDHPDGDPACYYEERDLEHHTCASMSSRRASCVDSATPSRMVSRGIIASCLLPRI